MTSQLAPSEVRRVLLIAPQFWPLIGGYESAAREMARELVRKQLAVTVVAERRSKDWASSEVLDGVQIRRLWCIYRRGWHVMTSVLSLAVYLLGQGRRFDVFHVFQHGAWAATAVACGWLVRRPVIVRTTSTSGEGVQKALGSGGVGFSWGAWLHRKADAWVATNERAGTELLEAGIPAARIALIPNGVDTQRFNVVSPAAKRDIRHELHLRGQPIAVFCGRLVEAKDPETLLQAWKGVIQRLPGATLVMIGGGPLRADLERWVRSEAMEESVIFTGPQPAVERWYQASDLFVLSSRYEGFSNSLLESMSCGLPVVSTRVSGTTDVFSRADVGAMVAVGDVPMLTEALLRLLEDPTCREEAGRRGRQLVESEYSMSAVASQTTQLYQRLMAVGRLAKAGV